MKQSTGYVRLLFAGDEQDVRAAIQAVENFARRTAAVSTRLIGVQSRETTPRTYIDTPNPPEVPAT